MRLFSIVALTLVLAACTRPGEAPPDAAPADTLTVLYVPAEGFAYTDDAGRLTGVTVEIMRTFGDWLEQEDGEPVALDFVREDDWTAFYGRVRDAEGSVFGLGNVTITEARRDELRFSPPYLTNVAVLITRNDVPELRSLDAMPRTFAGLDALAFEGTLHEERLQAFRDAHYPDAGLIFATSNAEIIERTAEGGFFAYVDVYNFWRARDAGAPLRHHPIADDPGETFGIIMPHANPYADRLDAFFEADGGFVGSPTYRSILVEHLGAQLAHALEAARIAADQ
jgi:hypothetical protein